VAGSAGYTNIWMEKRGTAIFIKQRRPMKWVEEIPTERRRDLRKA
jgi:hypothetical protein